MKPPSLYEDDEAKRRGLIELHRLMIREELTKLHSLFSSEPPPAIMAQLVDSVISHLNGIKEREVNELVELYSQGNRKHHKPVIKKMLESSGVNLDDSSTVNEKPA